MNWESLVEGNAYAFGFLVVDVHKCGSVDTADRQRLSEFLESFVREKAEAQGGKLWHWALDGGICGFLQQCDPMVRTAQDVLIHLNLARVNRNVPDFSVRMCLHFGLARWATDFERITGTELNWICKHEREVGETNAIIVTDEVYGLISDPSLKGRFTYHADCVRAEDGRVIKTYGYHPLSTANLVDIARRHYDEGQRIDVIALDYNLKEEEIQALLGTAEIRGIVRKKTIVAAPPAEELEKSLQQKFGHLRKIRVVDYRGPYIREEVAKAAAEMVRSLDIKPETSIAISCGTTVMELARNLEIDPGTIKNVSIFPLLITMIAEMMEVSPAGIISFLTRAFPNSVGYAAQFPKEEKNLQIAVDRKEVYAKDCHVLLEGARNARYMFTGLGSIGRGRVTHSFNRLIEKLGLVPTLREQLEAVGEFCYQPFTIDGKLLIDSRGLELLKANIIAVDLEELRKKIQETEWRNEGTEIFAIAGGREKHESILGGLRARVFNNLITDIETAEYLNASA